MKKTRVFYQDPKASAVSTQYEEPKRGRICKLCDRKFFIRDMITNSSHEIKAQNITIENALRQTRNWQNDISSIRANNQDKVINEKKKDQVLDGEIAQIEESISKL